MDGLDELLAGLSDGHKRTAKTELIKLKEQRWSELNIKFIDMFNRPFVT